MPSDYIFLDDLQVTGAVGLSAFSFKEKTFPLRISISVHVPDTDAADAFHVSYGDVYRDITGLVESQSFGSIEDLGTAIVGTPRVGTALRTLKIVKSGGFLRTKREIFAIDSLGNVSWSLEGITIPCIIGVYSHEQMKKQDIRFNLTIIQPHWSKHTEIRGQVDAQTLEEYRREMFEAVCTFIEASQFKTVEALGQKICELSLDCVPAFILGIRVWISKPSALAFVKDAGICVTRMRES